MKFLLAQINPVVGDLEGNAKKILTIASKASSISADFVLTPELSLWGYPANDLLFKKNLIKNQSQILDQLALNINKKYGNLSISVGIAEIINDSFFPNLYNSIALVEGGEWKIIARKIILPTYEVFDEKRYFRSEEKVSVLIKQIKNKTWRLGFTICEDLWVNKDIEGRGIHRKNPIIDLKKSYFWIVYPKNKNTQNLHLQVAGVWDPYQLNNFPNDSSKTNFSKLLEKLFSRLFALIK